MWPCGMNKKSQIGIYVTFSQHTCAYQYRQCSCFSFDSTAKRQFKPATAVTPLGGRMVKELFTWYMRNWLKHNWKNWHGVFQTLAQENRYGLVAVTNSQDKQPWSEQKSELYKEVIQKVILEYNLCFLKTLFVWLEWKCAKIKVNHMYLDKS